MRWAYGVVLQTPDAGDITIAAPVNAGSSRVLVGAAGAIVQGAGGLISAGSLTVNAGGAAGVGSSDAPLQTAVSTLRSDASSGSVHISNSGDLTINFIEAAGAVSVNASGSLTTPFPASCDCTPAHYGFIRRIGGRRVDAPERWSRHYGHERSRAACGLRCGERDVYGRTARSLSIAMFLAARSDCSRAVR